MTNTPHPDAYIIPLVDGAFICDNTTLELGTTCPLAFANYKLRRKERAAARAALAFGDIMHQALEVRYRACQQGQVLFDDATISAMLEKVRLGFEKWTPPEDEWRTYDVAVSAVLHYAKTYPIESSKIISVERPFLKPLGTVTLRDVWVRDERIQADGTTEVIITHHSHITIPILWAGRLDVIPERENGVYIRDHKTTSMMGPTYQKEFELSSQFLGYSWACAQELGQPPVGYEINGLGIRKPTRTGIGLEFKRFYYPVTTVAIDEWVSDTLLIIQTLLSYASISVSSYPRHLKHCQGKYGECQYKISCSLEDRNHRNYLLQTGEFKTVEWSPLNDR